MIKSSFHLNVYPNILSEVKVGSHGAAAAAIFLPLQLDSIITNGVVHMVQQQQWLWQWCHK